MRAVLNLVLSSIKMLVLRCVPGRDRAKFAYHLKNKCTFTPLVLPRCEEGLCAKNERIEVIQSVWAPPSLVNHANGPLQELEYCLLLRLMFLMAGLLCG